MTARAHRNHSTTWALGLVAASLGSACAGDAPASGGSGGGSPDAASQDGLVTCARPQDPVDTYLPNLVKTGSNGVLTFTLVESNNAPPVRNRNVWKLRITKGDEPATLGDVVPEVDMPLHTHPAGAQPQMTYDPASGIYTADPIQFFMAGYWASTFKMYAGPSSDANIVDFATFFFCVD
jgi:hypothetical protein